MVTRKARTNFLHLRSKSICLRLEGWRAAVLGQARSINYRVCLGMLWLFIAFFGFNTTAQFKKRLDYIG